eukprot:gnl/TRDRNA2_/TRDRNA2_127435_c0_seq4.p1 gnl/TRDRNA2_/TRDRNA2_127435_c0~~gnl/TRDRNA2_/TRDRNA2_127435_c0_seq4.p1  ORF type:complete len:653 (+),score=93.74 gnl/TRDRNA2_/TRDRNA2_127435_c0_seq4:50-2008(+)
MEASDEMPQTRKRHAKEMPAEHPKTKRRFMKEAPVDRSSEVICPTPEEMAKSETHTDLGESVKNMDGVGTRSQEALSPLADRLKLAKHGPTLIFDGICNLCNASMRWYYDRLCQKESVYFMWAQHDDTRPLLTELGISREDILSSWAYIEDEIVYRGSSAWFMAMRHLHKPWSLLSVLNLVPRKLRDGAYGCVARNRYTLLGSSDVCQRPEPQMRRNFLHSSASQSGESRKPQPALDETFPEQRRLLIVGCGFAGLYIARALASEFDVVVVDPKDYYEFTPGILRGFANPKHIPHLQTRFSQVFKDIPVSHVQGQVVSVDEHEAQVRLIGGEQHEHVITVPFHFLVMASGSQYAGGGLWKVTGAPGEESQVTLEGRNAGLAAALDELVQLQSRQGTVILVGAGLVGVELAAEIAHFLPGLKVVLADMAPSILPAMPEGARQYAHQWLVDHNVELRLGVALPKGGEAAALGVKGPSVVLGCAGIQMRNGFAEPLNCLNERGAIRVNHALQVLVNEPTAEDIDLMGPARARVSGSGRIFALGDCVSVDGAVSPIPKEVYPAEAMASIVVKNLRAGKTVQCLRTCPGILTELRLPLQAMTICSLGPNDAVFVASGKVIAKGRIATFMKATIESTKMSETRNEAWGNLVWSLVPHF